MLRQLSSGHKIFERLMRLVLDEQILIRVDWDVDVRLSPDRIFECHNLRHGGFDEGKESQLQLGIHMD